MRKAVASEKPERAPAAHAATKSKPPASKRKPAERLVLNHCTVDGPELESFLALKHGDPHKILGAHHYDGGIVIRAFRPAAERVEVVIGRKKPQPMVQTHDAGLFEILPA